MGETARTLFNAFAGKSGQQFPHQNPNLFCLVCNQWKIISWCFAYCSTSCIHESSSSSHAYFPDPCVSSIVFSKRSARVYSSARARGHARVCLAPDRFLVSKLGPFRVWLQRSPRPRSLALFASSSRESLGLEAWPFSRLASDKPLASKPGPSRVWLQISPRPRSLALFASGSRYGLGLEVWFKIMF